MRKEIRKITNTYINLIPKRIKEKGPIIEEPGEVNPKEEMITIFRREYEEMKATIATQSKQIDLLITEVKELRERITLLEIENTELRNVCDKYFATYGPLKN